MFRFLQHGGPGAALLSALLEGAAAVLFGVALAATYAGPIRFDLGWWTLSVRTVSRPYLAAAVLLGLRAVVRNRPAAGSDIVEASSRIAIGALAIAGVTGWLMHLSPTVGGADSYGYVSTAQRLLHGRLIEIEPLAPLLPFADAGPATAPLGYVSTPERPYASVPAYPLGLPAIMAAASLVGGPDAPFLIAPLTGFVLLVAAALVAWSWYRDGLTTLIAAALVAIHPLVFAYAIQPMSDVPAAACVLCGIVAVGRGRPLLAGVAVAIAMLIRPALAPTAAMLGVFAVVVHGRAGVPSALRVAAPLVLGAIVQAALHGYLYGGIFASGYGGVGELFSAERITTNLRSHAFWAFASMGLPAIAMFAIGLAASGREARVMFSLVAAALLATYLPYRTYDHWETLRFLLPAIALMTIMVASGIVVVARRVAGRAGGAAVAALVAWAVAWAWVGWLERSHVFTMAEDERRYRLAAEMVQQSTPRDAVILAALHSGSVRYYAERETLNWLRMPAGSIPDTARVLNDRGRRVYVMIDSAAELAEFRQHHGDVLERDGWLPAGQRRDVQLYEAPQR